MAHNQPPTFLTRAEVSALLRLSERQVDRLATAGVLEKQKLSARRAGFDKAGVAAYINRMSAGASTNTPPPTPTEPQDGTAFTGYEIAPGLSLGTMGSGGYGSRTIVYIIEVETRGAEVAAALDVLLSQDGVRGCLVMGDEKRISIVWARNLGLDPSVVAKAVEHIKSRATLAA